MSEAPPVKIEAAPFCRGEELRCRCDCGAEGDAATCCCVAGKGFWKQPPPTHVPGDTYKKEKYLDAEYEGDEHHFDSEYEGDEYHLTVIMIYECDN